MEKVMEKVTRDAYFPEKTLNDLRVALSASAISRTQFPSTTYVSSNPSTTWAPFAIDNLDATAYVMFSGMFHLDLDFSSTPLTINNLYMYVGNATPIMQKMKLKITAQKADNGAIVDVVSSYEHSLSPGLQTLPPIIVPGDQYLSLKFQFENSDLTAVHDIKYS